MGVRGSVFINSKGENMIPEVFSFTKIYAYNAASPTPIVVDPRFRYNTITVQPLNIPSPPSVLTEDLLTEANSVVTGVTGTVTFKASPPASYVKFDVTDSTINLSSPTFLNMSTPVFRLFPTLTSVTGCTHVAVTVTGFVS